MQIFIIGKEITKDIKKCWYNQMCTFIKCTYLDSMFSYLVSILIRRSAEASGKHEHPASPGSPRAIWTGFYCESHF